MLRLISHFCVTLLAAGFLAACISTPPAQFEIPTSLPGYVQPAEGTIYSYITDDGHFYQRTILASQGPVTTERSGQLTYTRFADLLYLENSGNTFVYDSSPAILWPLEVGKYVRLAVFKNGKSAANTTIEVTGRERVKVRAGEFDAFVVKVYMLTYADETIVTRWLVPELGRWVKYTQTTNKGTERRTEGAELTNIYFPPSISSRP